MSKNCNPDGDYDSYETHVGMKAKTIICELLVYCYVMQDFSFRHRSGQDTTITASRDYKGYIVTTNRDVVNLAVL